MLGFLKALDFGYLSGPTTMLSAQQAAGVLWDATPLGTSAVITEQDFKNRVMTAFSSGYEMVLTDTLPPNAVPDSVIAASPEFRGKELIITGILSSLRSKGYYIVSTQAPSVQAMAPASRGQVAQPTQTPVSAASGGGVQIPARNKTNYVYRQAPKTDRSRLYWTLGIAAAIFVVAIGAIAARE